MRTATVTDLGKIVGGVAFALLKAVLLLAAGTLALRGIELMLTEHLGAGVKAVFAYLYIAFFGLVIGYAIQSYAKFAGPKGR